MLRYIYQHNLFIKTKGALTMAIGERIHFFRTKRGMTQKYVGSQIGFDEKSADVRLAQYESETRVPKDNLITALASVFDVAPAALKVPDIDSYIGLMHTLFALEDRYGLKIEKAEDGQPRLYLDIRHFPDSIQLYDMFLDWMDKATSLEEGKLSQDDYDTWRYHYPTPGETTHTNFTKVIPQGLSDLLIASLKEIEKSDSK